MLQNVFVEFIDSRLKEEKETRNNILNKDLKEKYMLLIANLEINIGELRGREKLPRPYLTRVRDEAKEGREVKETHPRELLLHYENYVILWIRFTKKITNENYQKHVESQKLFLFRTVQH
jgi:hypothetical protein